MFKSTNNLWLFLLFVILSAQDAFNLFYRILFVVGAIGIATDSVLTWWYHRPRKIFCIKCEEEIGSKDDHFVKKCTGCYKRYWTCRNTENLSEGERARDHKKVTCSICQKKYYKCAKVETSELVGDALHGEGKCQPPDDGNIDS